MSNLAELAQQLGGTIGAIDHARDQAAVALEMITGLPVDPPPEPEPGVVMTAYSQRDPRWRDEIYAGGLTFGQAGCYVTCVAMIASLAGYEDDPPTVASRLRKEGVFSGALLAHPERIAQAYPLLRYDGTVHWRNVPADLGELQDQLNGGPVIVETEFRPGGAMPPEDQHFVIAGMFDVEGNDLVIADPWDGARTKLLTRYALDNWNLARAIYGLRLLRVAEG